MKVFLCSYNGFSLAVPMDKVSSVMLITENNNHKSLMHFSSDNGNTYISLPLLFNCPSLNMKHGIILKNSDSDDDIAIKDKTILLTTEIECESEISDDKILTIPKTLNVFKFSLFFSGILFYRRQPKISENLILLLNPEHMVQKINKEKTND